MRVAKIVLFGGGIVVLAVLGMFDPSKFSFFPRCPFLLLTGLQCPGCGTQRALHQLLHLHIGEAFRYNAMMVRCWPRCCSGGCSGTYSAGDLPVRSACPVRDFR